MENNLMMTSSNIILLLTSFSSALIAGLFYAYTCSVNPGLGRLPDAGYIAAMQSINKAILNPIFYFSFFGTLIFLPVCAYLHYGQHDPAPFWLLISALIIYLTGVFGVTAIGNIPLNEALDRFNLLSASSREITAQREMFEKRWNNLNSIRTVSSSITILLVIIACLCKQKQV